MNPDHSAAELAASLAAASMWAVFRTRRCLVRPLVDADIDTVAAYRDDLEWMRFQGLKGLPRQEYVERLIGAGFSAESGGQLGVVDEASGVLVGDLYVKLEPPVCWIGYTISPTYARRGYGLEVVQGLLEALTVLPDVMTVKADVEPGNVASINLLITLGFTLAASDTDSPVYQLGIAS